MLHAKNKSSFFSSLAPKAIKCRFEKMELYSSIGLNQAESDLENKILILSLPQRTLFLQEGLLNSEGWFVICRSIHHTASTLKWNGKKVSV